MYLELSNKFLICCASRNIVLPLQATSLSSQLSKFEDKKRKHVQTLERKTSNMKQMFKKGKGEIVLFRTG